MKQQKKIWTVNSELCEKNGHDQARRTLLKSSACTLGVLYLAPSTLNLLMTDRANAQSAPLPLRCPNRSGFTWINESTHTVTLTWGGQPAVVLPPGSSSTQPIANPQDLSECVGDNEMLSWSYDVANPTIDDEVYGCSIWAQSSSAQIAQMITWFPNNFIRIHSCTPLNPAQRHPLFG